MATLEWFPLSVLHVLLLEKCLPSWWPQVRSQEFVGIERCFSVPPPRTIMDVIIGTGFKTYFFPPTLSCSDPI